MRTWEIIDNEFHQGLKVTETDGTIRCVGLDIRNGDYREFLAWNAQQSEPLVLPEGWPTLGE